MFLLVKKICVKKKLLKIEIFIFFILFSLFSLFSLFVNYESLMLLSDNVLMSRNGFL